MDLDIAIRHNFYFSSWQGQPIQKFKYLQGQTVTLGQLSSATGYYFPMSNLYGLTLPEIIFALAPKTFLEWVAQGKVNRGALSREEFSHELYKYLGQITLHTYI